MVLAAVALALLVRALAVESYRVGSGSMAPTLLDGDHVLVSKLAYGLRVPLLGARLGGAPPRRGDVVVFEAPGAPGTDTVKRVVGIPGDVVELREQVLFVGGVPQPRIAGGELVYAERREGGAAFEDACRRYREALAQGDFPPSDPAEPAAREASWQAAAAGGVASYETLQCLRARLGAREGPYGPVPPGHLFVLGDNRDRSADGRGDARRGGPGWFVPVEAVQGRVVRVLFGRSAPGPGAATGPGPRIERLFKPVE